MFLAGQATIYGLSGFLTSELIEWDGMSKDKVQPWELITHHHYHLLKY